MKIKGIQLDQEVEKVALVKIQGIQITMIGIFFNKGEVMNIAGKDQNREREATATQEETVRRDTVFLKAFILDRAVNNFRNAT